MDQAIRAMVRRRAENRCEYCRIQQDHISLSQFHIEHITPKQHGGGDEADNLCLSCNHCNLHKGPNLVGIDPDSGKLARLFHPRNQSWTRHFRWNGPVLEGRTQIGRATSAVLDINNPDRVELRDELVDD